MGNRPDGLVMSQARDRAAIRNLEDASFGPGCGVGGLIEKAPQVAVTLRRPVTVVKPVSSTGSQPSRLGQFSADSLNWEEHLHQVLDGWQRQIVYLHFIAGVLRASVKLLPFPQM